VGKDRYIQTLEYIYKLPNVTQYDIRELDQRIQAVCQLRL
jgi:hypothetical protein